MRTLQAEIAYNKRETAAVAKFVEGLKEAAAKTNPVTGIIKLDSIAANDFVIENQSRSNGVAAPGCWERVMEEFNEDQRKVVIKAMLDGIETYERQHGCTAPADLLEQALHSAYGTTDGAKRKYRILDNASSNHHDQISLQPNRAVVAIMAIMGDAIPFAHYLPADIGSNQAILAIMSHNAGSTYGRYAEGALMDGAQSGDAYINASRIHKANPNGTGQVSGRLTTVQDTQLTCAVGAPGVKLLRGRTIVYVNGIPCAREIDSTGSGDSTVSGGVSISGVSYQIAGTINTDTGVFALATTPALPTTVPVLVEGFIDYERDPSITPRIITNVQTFNLYANPWRCLTDATIDSRTQMSNELGLDPYSEGVLAIQAQFSNERHYKVLQQAMELSSNNQTDHDFEWVARSAQMNRSQIWQDFASPLGRVSQQMALDTMNHGVTHLYVGRNLAAQWMSLPRDLFEPSGVAERPCIFRIGRLFGRFEVYYTPKGVTETETSSQVLAIGKATDVTRNPFVLGDAVPPTVIPVATGTDMTQRSAFYARNFTCVNPHGPSALGAARINITNLQ